MQKSIKLTREQVFFLSFSTVIGNMVYIHTWIDNEADRAAWVAIFLGILMIVPLALWILYLGKMNPQKNIFDILEAGMGKFPSGLFRMIFIFINMAIAIVQLNMFTQMLRAFFLLYTPTFVIMLILVLICGIFINSGIKVFARTVEILGTLALINYFTSFIFAFPNSFHIKYVLPIFDTSVLGVLKGSLFITGNASELLLLLMIIIPFIPDPLKHYRWVVGGIVLSAIIFSLAVLVIIGILSPEIAKTIAFGGVNASIIIQVGDYISGLEIFVFGSYQFIAIGKISICMYCIWTSTKQIFTSKGSGIQLIIIGLIILIPSAWINSYNKAYFISVFLGNYMILPFTVITLFLTTTSIAIRKKLTGSGS